MRFYQDVLGFPLTEIVENRDYAGLEPLLLRHRQRQPAGVLRPARAWTSGSTPRCSAACTTWRSRWTRTAGARCASGLDAAGVDYEVESGTSIYFRDPDGARLELIADPLGEMYGLKVL